MNEYLRRAIIFLIIVIAVISLVITFTEAQGELQNLNFSFIALSTALFISSIFVWIFSWAFLIKKNAKLSYKDLLKVGFSSVYGALTPVQLGAEALRSIQLKYYFKISYSESVSASMVVKGLKFLVLLIAAFFVLSISLSNVSLEPAVLFAFVSGFAVIALAVGVFLLPLKKSFGISIANFFKNYSKLIKQFNALSDFFKSYSQYLEKTTISALFITLILACLSFLLEFLALSFAFASAGVFIGLKAILVLMILVSILERTPFLPRGVGIVEIVAFNFLTLPIFASSQLSAAQIGAAIIAFDIVRLVIPTIASFACLGIFSKGLEKASVKKKSLF